jgi:dihydroneopterin triphosphate aldolase (PTPS-III) / 6-pyruvoyltetrahydropterin synthase
MVFEIIVSKNDMKFSCAHFIAYDGFREMLHGHNYNLTMRLIGTVLPSCHLCSPFDHSQEISSEGYLLDFGVVKRVWFEFFLSIPHFCL